MEGHTPRRGRMSRADSGHANDAKPDFNLPKPVRSPPIHVPASKTARFPSKLQACLIKEWLVRECMVHPTVWELMRLAAPAQGQWGTCWRWMCDCSLHNAYLPSIGISNTAAVKNI